MADAACVRAFLSNHSHLELIKDKDNKHKVRCRLTGHELPCRVSELQTYTKGKKYQRLLQNRNKADTSWHKYKEFLVPNVKSKKHDQLFCKLTKKAINNVSHHIERHVNGKRFQRALAKYEKSLEEGETNGAGDMWIPSGLDSDSADEGAIKGSGNESDDKVLEIEEENENTRDLDSDEHRVEDTSANSDKRHKDCARGSPGSIKRPSKEAEEEGSLPKKKKKTESKKAHHNNTKCDKNSKSVKQKSNAKHTKNLSKKPKQMRKKKRN